MKTTVTLDKRDVQIIIANHFKVDPKNVDVNLFITTEGYGMGEHNAASMDVTVTTNDGTTEP